MPRTPARPRAAESAALGSAGPSPRPGSPGEQRAVPGVERRSFPVPGNGRIRLESAPNEGAVVAQLGLDDASRLRAFLDATPGEPVAGTRGGAVHRLDLATPRASAVYLKLTRRPKFLHRLAGLLGRESRLVREFRALRRLAEAGVPVVPAVAAGEVRRFGILLGPSFLVTREASGLVPLHTFLAGLGASGVRALPAGRRRAAIDALAVLVATLHRQRFAARDLHFRNILVDPAVTEGALPSFCLLDQPRAVRRRRARALTRGRVFDLACLDKHAPEWFTRSERLRFFRTWLDHLGSPVPRSLLSRIASRRAALLDLRAAKLARSSPPPADA